VIAAPASLTRQLFEAARGLPAMARVERESRTILGAKAMQLGPLAAGDARPWKVDATTLSQLRDLVNAKQGGVKMRFAHPNMSRDGMGRHLGRATNARIVEDPQGAYVAVDARLADPSLGKRTGEMVEHVLALAQQAPEDFGLSIAPILDHEAMKKIEPDENGLRPIRLQSLHAIDFVDEPAATRGGLFSLDSSDVADLPARATDLLDTFFAESPADVIRARFGEFLDRYLSNRGDVSMTTAAAAPSTEQTPVTFTPAAPVVVQQSTLAAAVAEPYRTNEQQESRDMLKRQAEIGALCQLAKVDDATRDLMIRAGFSRAEAQDYLKSSGFLSAQNPPVQEGVEAASSKPDPDAQFAAEYEQYKDVYDRQGVTKEQYIASRKRG
jgi:hypothetical protein